MSLLGRLSSIPPVFCPNRISDLIGCLHGPDARGEVDESIRAYLGKGSVFLYESGRAAMTAALAAMRRLMDRSEVILPAYTCFTVPSAVAAAVLKFVPCDVEKGTLGLSPDALEKVLSERTLCVIPTHLYGVPCRIREILRIVEGKGVWVFEDAAQALGGRLGDSPMGSIGHLSLFSLGRGKNLDTGGGGILFVRDTELADALKKTTTESMSTASDPGYSNIMRILAANILGRPPFYGIVRSLPGLEIGVSRFERDIKVRILSRVQTRLLAGTFGRIEELREIRTRNAQLLLDGLREMDWVEKPKFDQTAQPAWLRLPILVPSEVRDGILKNGGENLGISASYPAPIQEIPEAGHYRLARSLCPVSEEIAASILTLPTHPRVTRRKLRAILDCIGRG